MEWCASPWPMRWKEMGLCRNFTLLERFPIIVAIELWGLHIRDRAITFWSDNLKVVHCVNHLSSSSPPVIALLRHLVLRCIDFNIFFRAYMLWALQMC